ncbi:Brp/Blh family beta-carotene 15,15'-dioxygenase [Phnomibacter sp. MR]|uniref:Brp/Blh family beta-carotene 15,15'-dioxygenase n=1 Tax=Phnomibacter sp. MR TaxID=3042318 RepID=UPI003A810374
MLTMFIVIPFLFGWQMPAGTDLVILVASLAITGIPHGAIDHVIYKHHHPAKAKGAVFLLTFFVPYILMLTATLVMWLFFPTLMFWFFLLVSAYHFGQSQLYYVSLSERHVLKVAVYIVWGVFVLSNLWYHHWVAQQVSIQSLFDWDLSVGSALHQVVNVTRFVSAGLWAVFMIYLIRKKMIKPLMLLQELLVIGLLYLLIKFTTMYLAFAIYFGIWHSLRVILTEYHHLQKQTNDTISLIQFCKAFIPFSLISFGGIVLLFVASYFLESLVSPFMLFLVFISALTMPHAYVMHEMYARMGQKLHA